MRTIARLLIAAVLSIVCLQAAYLLVDIFVERMHGASDGDIDLFFAVGRGMINGLKPYIDVWENKPPLIFILSALSLLLGGDSLAHFLEATAIIGIPFLVAVACLHGVRARGMCDVRRIWFIAGTSFLVGTLLSLLIHLIAADFHTEIFGSFFGCLYVALIAGKRMPLSWTSTIAAGVAMLLSVGSKEPFFFSLLAAAILFADSPRTFVHTFIAPAAVAMVLGIASLLVLDLFWGYFFVYLPYLVFEHETLWALMVHRNAPDPTLSLGIALPDTWGYLAHVPLLPFIAAIGWVVALCVPFLQRPQGVTLFGARFHLYRIILCTYLAVFAANLSSELAIVPSLAALAVVLCSSDWDATRLHLRGIPLALTSVLAMLAILIAPPVASPTFARFIPPAATVAQQIDTLLDACGIERYLILSNMQPSGIYAYTRHSPLPSGPFIVELGQRMQIPIFATMILRSLEQADIILIKTNEYEMGELASSIKDNFSTNPWPCSTPIEIPTESTVLYRVGK